MRGVVGGVDIASSAFEGIKSISGGGRHGRPELTVPELAYLLTLVCAPAGCPGSPIPGFPGDAHHQKNTHSKGRELLMPMGHRVADHKGEYGSTAGSSGWWPPADRKWWRHLREDKRAYARQCCTTRAGSRSSSSPPARPPTAWARPGHRDAAGRLAQMLEVSTPPRGLFPEAPEGALALHGGQPDKVSSCCPIPG
jgi:hypothetical protein